MSDFREILLWTGLAIWVSIVVWGCFRAVLPRRRPLAAASASVIVAPDFEHSFLNIGPEVIFVRSFNVQGAASKEEAEAALGIPQKGALCLYFATPMIAEKPLAIPLGGRKYRVEVSYRKLNEG